VRRRPARQGFRSSLGQSRRWARYPALSAEGAMTTRPQSRVIFELTLRPAPTNDNPIASLRQALKLFKRRFGLVCIRAEEHHEPNWKTAGDAAARVLRRIAGDAT